MKIELQKKIVADSIRFWDETEALIKKAETISTVISVPAIGELRYGGRKLVDFVNASLSGAASDVSDEHIFEFKQCCIKARHDAVDAIVMYMKAFYESLLTKFDAALLHDGFKYDAELRSAFATVDKRVILSREERHSRNELYTKINDSDIDDLIEKFGELKHSEKIIEAQRRYRKREHRIAIASMLFGLIGVALSVYFYLHTGPAKPCILDGIENSAPQKITPIPTKTLGK